MKTLLRKVNIDKPTQLYQYIQGICQKSQNELLSVLINKFSLQAALSAALRFFLFQAADAYQIFLEQAASSLDQTLA